MGPTLKRLERAGLVRHKEPYWAAAADDKVAAATAAFIGVGTVGTSFEGDWYDENKGWAEDLPEVSDEDSA